MIFKGQPRSFSSLSAIHLSKLSIHASGNEIHNHDRSGDWCGRWDSNPHDVAIEGF
jgi:hypothetical protein